MLPGIAGGIMAAFAAGTSGSFIGVETSFTGSSNVLTLASVALGSANLVAVDAPSIAAAANHLLDAPRPAAVPFDAHAPYGDGHAGMRIAEHLLAFQQTSLAHDAPRLVPLTV